jgi:hypothetical protein
MTQYAPDWGLVIEQIVATGMTPRQISQHSGITLSIKALRYLETGVQPLFHRGDALVRIWVERTGRPRDEIPLAPLRRGLRKTRQARDTSPKVGNAAELADCWRAA